MVPTIFVDRLMIRTGLPKHVSNTWKSAIGLEPMVILFFSVSLIQPSRPVITSFTWYIPGEAYKCGGGFCKLLPVPSPKSQYQDCMGANETELSVKVIGVPKQTPFAPTFVEKPGFNAVQNCCKLCDPPVAAVNPQKTFGSLLKIVPIMFTCASTRKWPSK